MYYCCVESGGLQNLGDYIPFIYLCAVTSERTAVGALCYREHDFKARACTSMRSKTKAATRA